MAEARLAVAFQFQVTDEGSLRVNLDQKLIYNIGLSLFRSGVRRFQRLRNAILRTISPASPYTLLALLLLLVGVQYWLPHQAVFLAWQSRLPVLRFLPDTSQGPVAAFVLAALLWTMGLYVQRYLLMFALTYKGYLFVSHGKTPFRVRLWFLLVKVLHGSWRPKSLYAYGSSLPRLPLPSVADTCRRYLETARPLLDDQGYARMRRLAAEFENGLGRRLQRYLWLKWIWSGNYVSDWWERYVYLRGRSPLMINSNYYILDSPEVATSCQSARAASILNILGRCKLEIEIETLKPMVIQGAVPVCMNQYRRTFGTSRIPGKVEDTLCHVSGEKSSHVAVFRRGRYYRLPLFWNGRLLQPAELERLIQLILDDDVSATAATDAELHLPALTAGERTKWAMFREKHLLSNRTNRHSLNIIESAALFLVLEDDELHPRTDDAESMCNFGRQGMHGNGASRWFDKTITLATYANGLMTCTAEHSWADAPVVAHVMEYAFSNDWLDRANVYSPDGHCKGEVLCPVRVPERLAWQLPQDSALLVEEAKLNAEALIADLDLHILPHTQFGKGAIKKCRMSPDAFIQMALQLAYKRDVGHFSLTYEASMTRLYREGRTETVRPVTCESVAFVRSMDDPTVPVEQRRALLQAAGLKHQDNYRHAMAGHGVDRHLFSLYIVSKYLDIDSLFLKEVLSEPWRLSTSQTPLSQMGNRASHSDIYSPGGGFGPVTDDGYGVSYIIIDESGIFFHVSSKHSSAMTNSHRFADNICRAMHEMIQLFNVKV